MAEIKVDEDAKNDGDQKKPKTKTRHRGYQEGSIVKRKDGRWSARIQITDPITGKKKRPGVYGKTREEVKKKLTELMADHQKGINIAPDKITLSAWIDQWLNDYIKNTVRQGTWEGYETYYRNHIKDAEIGKKILSKLTTNDLQKFYNAKAVNGRKDGKGLSKNAIRLIHFVISSSLKQAHKEGHIPRNVAEFVRLPNTTTEQKEMKVLTPDQIAIFLNGIQEDRLYAAFVLELGSGMRRGELLALRWQDVNLETGECKIIRSLVRGVSGEMHINEPKTKSSKRVIFLPIDSLEVLKIHKSNQNKEKMSKRKEYSKKNDLIFCDEFGDYLKPDAFVKHYKRLLKNCGLPVISFHALRHSVATALLIDNVPIKQVQDLFGHGKSFITSDIYTHVLPQVKNRTAESLNKLIPKQKTN